ncbi:MAG: cupin domain-containing protein [Acidobacteriota bacterium]
MNFTGFADLAAQIEVPVDGTISKTLYRDDRLKVVLFGFAAGEELSEHTAATPAILHFLDGEAVLTLGDETREAGLGTWVHMPARLPHSISATAPTKMLLLLLKNSA